MAGEERLDRGDRTRVIRRRMFEATGADLPVDVPPLRSADLLRDRLRDRLPPALQGLPSFGPLHLSVLLVGIALVLFVLAWWVSRSGVRGEVIPPPPSLASPVAATAGAASPAPASASTDSAEVVVDVAGKVRHPGVYHLPAGARVIDALEAAGGPRRGVDLAQINLARVLADGEQILILKAPERASRSTLGSSSGTPGGPVNINRADQSLLETLPGVGPVTAAAIVSWREQNGRFSSVDDLVEVSGIGDATLARLRPFITV